MGDKEKDKEREKEGRMRLGERVRKKKNHEIQSRIVWLILAEVKVRTSAFSFYPSVVYLAEKLLWFFQFGRITLCLSFHFLSELMWKK